MKKDLNLPYYYGENFDALWDFLTTWIETPIEIIWTNLKESKRNLGDFSVEVVSFFDEAQKEIGDFLLNIDNKRLVIIIGSKYTCFFYSLELCIFQKQRSWNRMTRLFSR